MLKTNNKITKQVADVFGIPYKDEKKKKLLIYFWVYSVINIILMSTVVGFMYYGFPIIPGMDKCTVPVISVISLSASSMYLGVICKSLSIK